MYQVPSLTFEYEESRATICPPGCAADSAVSVQLNDSLAGSGTLLSRVSDSPNQTTAASETSPHGDLLDSPAWPLHTTGSGREMR
jgi:hypothetical protein